MLTKAMADSFTDSPHLMKEVEAVDEAVEEITTINTRLKLK
jgi:hypothetical protein